MSGEYKAGVQTSGDRVHVINEHLHNSSKVYPTGAAGVAVVTGGAAWTLGNYSEIVPVNTITSPFDIHHLVIEAIGANAVYEIVLYAGTTEIARTRLTCKDQANARIFPNVPIMCPILAANTQIQAKCMTANVAADSITISIQYHTY